jgi:alpha-tubulin suppressor-like RCC1 family protein
MNAIFKKLNYKDQTSVCIINPPDSFKQELTEMKELTSVKTSFSHLKEISFLLAFVTKQKEVDDLSKKVSVLLQEDGLLWFAYPKGTSKKYKCEFNRDNGWNELGRLGFEPVRMVAIDEDWSAMRFRKAENIKKMTRGRAISNTGQQRINSDRSPKK